MIEYWVALLYVAAVFLGGLGILVYYVNRKSTENQLFSIWMAAEGAWALTIAAFFTANNVVSAELWMKMAYVAAIVGIFSFFCFALIFVKRFKFNTILLIVDVLALSAMIVFTLTNDLIVTGVAGAPYVQNVKLSNLGWALYATYLLIHFLAAHLILYQKYREATGATKTQLKYVFVSILVGGEIFGVLFNLILPSPIFLNWQYIWLGPVASAFIVVPVVSYAVTRHKLFNIKRIVGEILIFYGIIYVVINAIISTSIGDLIRNMIMAAVISLLGTMLVKNLREEEQRKIKLQQLAADLATANAKLEERDQMRSEFISMASHQLRTPVSVMKGYISLMLDGDFGRIPKKIKDKLSLMFEMNERLVLLVNNMLNASRIEKNRIDFGFGEVKIDEIGKSVIGEMTFKAEQKGLDLKFNKYKGDMPTVISDSEKIREIMMNLIDNSIKYTHEGSVELGFDVDRTNEHVLVYVKDTGYGMTEEDAKHVFEKFYRAERPDAPKEHGTGLGLYIVTRFIRGMGGDIWISDTAPGKGATFMFTIPFNPPEELQKPNSQQVLNR